MCQENALSLSYIQSPLDSLLFWDRGLLSYPGWPWTCRITWNLQSFCLNFMHIWSNRLMPQSLAFFVNECVYMYVWFQRYVCAHARRGQKSVLGEFHPHFAPLRFWDKTQLVWLDFLANEPQRSSCLCYLGAEISGMHYPTLLGFFFFFKCVFWKSDLTSRPISKSRISFLNTPSYSYHPWLLKVGTGNAAHGTEKHQRQLTRIPLSMLALLLVSVFWKGSWSRLALNFLCSWGWLWTSFLSLPSTVISGTHQSIWLFRAGAWALDFPHAKICPINWATASAPSLQIF